jgi:hypothetical protein
MRLNYTRGGLEESDMARWKDDPMRAWAEWFKQATEEKVRCCLLPLTLAGHGSQLRFKALCDPVHLNSVWQSVPVSEIIPPIRGTSKIAGSLLGPRFIQFQARVQIWSTFSVYSQSSKAMIFAPQFNCGLEAFLGALLCGHALNPHERAHFVQKPEIKK